MSDKSSSASGGIGFVGLLTIVFVTLRLIEKIDWPWVWVLSPLWIGAALWVLMMLGLLIFLGLASLADKK